MEVSGGENARTGRAPPVIAGPLGDGTRARWPVKIGAMAVLQGVFSFLLLVALGYGLAHEEAGRTVGSPTAGVVAESVYDELTLSSRDALFLAAAGIVAILALAAGIAMLSMSKRARALLVAWLVAGLAMVPATVVWLVMTGQGAGGRAEEGEAAGIIAAIIVSIIGIAMLALWYAGLPAAALVIGTRPSSDRRPSAS